MNSGFFDDFLSPGKTKTSAEKLALALKNKGIKFKKVEEIPGGFKIICGYVPNTKEFLNRLYPLACESKIRLAGAKDSNSGNETFFFVQHRE